jgi:hypothetical protein
MSVCKNVFLHGDLSLIQTVRRYTDVQTQFARQTIPCNQLLHIHGDIMAVLQEAPHFNIKVYFDQNIPEEAWLLVRHGRAAYAMSMETDAVALQYIRESRHVHKLVDLVAPYRARALDACMRDWMNPLIPNDRGLLAADLTKDAALAARLRAYAQWQPWPVQKTWWYGPFFAARAKTMALVGKRFGIPRDVCHCIIRQLAALEIVWIPNFNTILTN